MGDSNSLMVLLAALKHTKVFQLNLSRNKLKYKFGFTILSVLDKIDTLFLKTLDLTYNSISETVIRDISTKLNSCHENSIIQQEGQSKPFSTIHDNTTQHPSPSSFNIRATPNAHRKSNSISARDSQSFLEKRQVVKQYIKACNDNPRNKRSKSVHQIPNMHPRISSRESLSYYNSNNLDKRTPEKYLY
jgi:hypothetical protein